MAIKKSELYSSLWASCDELRGGMDASQYKDYVLTLLFVKYVSDKYAGQQHGLIEVPQGASFDDMIALKGQPDIGDRINKEILRPLFAANGLEGSMELVDFNDDEKLGSGKEKVDRLSNLVSIFENPSLNFKNNRAEDDDILGDAYEYLMRHFATESGKSKGQFYTASEISRVMSKIIDVDKADRPSFTVYDMTCGSGSLLLKVAGEAKHGLTIYGQEKDIATKGLAIMNMWLHGYPEATIAGRNTIADPQFKEPDGSLKRFDYAVANPPFSTKNWSNGIVPMEDEFNRFIGYGVPPDKNGDYAFLLHFIASLKSTGKGAIILPHGVLFRGNAESTIRKQIIDRGLIKGIIGLPANLFYGTGIPACIIVIDKENADSRDGIFMIDASKDYKKDGNKNRLREQDIHKIVDVFNNQWELDKYARFVPSAEIEKNEYNLNIPRYIDTQEEEDIQDLNAHLNGGIPDRDIESLSEYWEVYPNLKETLFTTLREGYKKITVDKSEIKDTIFEHPEFKAYSLSLNEIFEDWKSNAYETLSGVTGSTSPKQFIRTISESILKQYSNRPLVNRYDIYQHLMDYWSDIIKDDIYMLIEDGWEAKVSRIIETNKRGKQVDKGWTCELIPKALVIDRYLNDVQIAIQDMESELESLQAKITEYEEEYGGEDECLNEVTKPTEARVNLLEYLLLGAKEYFPELAKRHEGLHEKLESQLERIKELEEEVIIESLRNNKGNITQNSAKAKLNTHSASEEGYNLILNWIDTKKSIPKTKKEIKQIANDIEESIQSLVEQNSDLEYLKEISVLNDYVDLHDQQKRTKSNIKQDNTDLDSNTLKQYHELTEVEVKSLVIDDKWLASIQADIQSEIDGISQRLTSRIKELAERYENTMTELDDAVSISEELVSGHLQKMGLSWS